MGQTSSVRDRVLVRLAILWLGLLVALIGTGIVRGQDSPPIRGPVSALRIDGDRLLIGQGSRLIEARVIADELQVIRVTDVKRHNLRAIAVSRGITFVLSEDGLTTLDNAGNLLGFVAGGGQRLAVRAERAYISAREVGIRVINVAVTGKLTQIGTFKTASSALDLATEGDSWLWVAEGSAGIRLYNAVNPTAPTTLLWLGDLTPATTIRVSGARIVVGHGSRFSILDTTNIRAPRILGTVAPDGNDAGNDESQISDILIQGNRAFVGRMGISGPDVVAVDISRSASLTLNAHFGEGGAGEHLAVYGDDLFIGSGRSGLRRLRFGLGGDPTVVATWEPNSSAVQCALAPPVEPQPPNLGQVQPGTVTLSWKAACNPSAYELRINGRPVATLKSATYAFTPERSVTSWQVVAIDAAGRRVESARWTFETLTEGWLAMRIPALTGSLLYVAPLIDLQSPGALLVVTCAVILIGLAIVIAGAWAIGMLAERRALRTHGPYE
jgi:hypothetical protein